MAVIGYHPVDFSTVTGYSLLGNSKKYIFHTNCKEKDVYPSITKQSMHLWW